MSYEIHIEHEASPITLDEWRGAIECTEDVRLAKDMYTITNPKTGEIITLRNDGADAEIFFPADATWRHVLHWSPRGTISFVPPADFDQSDCHFRRIALVLAQTLKASLIGDEGETYE